MRKKNTVRGVQTSKRQFLFVIDLPTRHHSAVSKNLWRQGSDQRKGNLGEGAGGEGQKAVEYSNVMITKNKNQQVKIDSPHSSARVYSIFYYPSSIVAQGAAGTVHTDPRHSTSRYVGR